MPKPLEITITVDTAFSIGKSFADPKRFSPVGDRGVLCEVDGRSEGLGFMLDTFKEYNIKASFFIETAQHAYFGDDPMYRIAEKIINADQDTQMLLHPAWYYYDKSSDFPANDSCAERSYDEIKNLIQKSLDAYERMCGKRPDVFRAANGQIDKQIYQILNELDIALSSSIVLEKYIPTGKDYLLYTGRAKLDGVMEVPVFTYQDKDIMGRYPTKSLQIASCSWREMRLILRKARKEGVENIVLLTEPSDYIKKRDSQFLEIRENKTNQDRLQKLCSFIKEYNQDYISVDFASRIDEWKGSEQENRKKFKIPTRYRNARKIENFINYLIWSR